MSSDLSNSALQLGDCIVSTPRFRLFRARQWPADRPVLAKALGSESGARSYNPRRIRPAEQTRYSGVLEPVAGGTLLALLNIAEPIDVGRTLRIAIGIAEVLSGLHANHRIGADLRPEHWLVDPQLDSVHLIDVAASLPDTPPARAPLPTSTVDWASLAPEQTGRMSLPLDARADLYVLGFLM